jgi:ankyrin repeat protein
MTRPVPRVRKSTVAEVWGLVGLLLGSAVLAAGPGNVTMAARPTQAPATTPNRSDYPRPPASPMPRADGLATLDRNLITAASLGDADLVHRLLSAGASARASDDHGRSALLAAVYARHAEVARILVRAGADVNAKDRESNSAFLVAASTGQADIVRLALMSGADLRSTDRYHGTALISACQHGNAEVVKALLSAGVPVDLVNDLGWSALLEAIVLGDGSAPYEEIVQMLVDAGADANLADRDGISPSRHARDRGYKGIVKILMRARGH